MKIVTDDTADSKRSLTSRAGLVVLSELIRHLKLSEKVDELRSLEWQNRTDRSSAIFNPFVLMNHESGRSLEDVRT